MKKIQAHTFKHTLRDIHEHTENRKFCFVIGSGASFKSGIPIGGELARKWFDEIKERFSKTEISKWIKDVKLDEKDLAAHYGSIYRKRFESDKTSGYEFLVQAMKNAKPTFGHIVLAQILSKVPGHCVLTTNFDSLVETAIYQFTDKTPLVCGHESLSGYARPSNIHPLIIKIHRDLLLDPKSDPDEISTLDNGWKDPLDKIFSSHIPIVIGYGGNDGSLMSYFEQMNKPSNFFWCDIRANPASTRVKKLIQKMDGSHVQIKGFDEIMHELLWVFDEIKPIDEELNGITKTRIESVDHQLSEIIGEDITKSSSSTTVKKNKPKKELSAFEYSLLAEDEPDFEKRKAVYIEAVEKFPLTDWLWNEFTYFLHFIKHDYDNLEEYYRKALSIQPENEYTLGNFSVFLYQTKKDYTEAEKYFQKALAVNPENGINHANFANFLKSVKKDYDRAEKHYQKALQIHPEGPHKNGNYASFLLVTGRTEEGTEYLEKAFDLNGIAENELLLELWFYKYAHFPKESLEESERKIERLLESGIRSIDWDFSENISVAIQNGHPNPEKLKEFAERINLPID